MSLQFRFRFAHFVCFGAFFAATQAVAQPFGYPSCKQPDIQTSLHFYQAPQGDQVVAVEYRNIGNWTCVLAPFDTNSEKDIHLGGYFIPVEIAKGNAVHSSFRWHAADPEPGINCDPLYTLPFLSTTLRNPLPFVAAWILVPPACSQLKQTPYLSGPFVPDWQPSGGAEKPLPSAPVLTVDKDTYYGFEPIELHVRLTDRPASDASCPYLVEKWEDAYGNSGMVESVRPGVCHYVLLPGRASWAGSANEFDIPAGTSFIGENTFTIYQVADPTPYGELRLVPSNSVTVKVLPAPRACVPDELEPTLHFYRPSESLEVVSLDYRNTSDSVCMMAPVRATAGPEIPRVAILPGQTVHTAQRWNMEDKAPSNRCQQGGLNFWVSQPSPTVAISAPTLLTNACAIWTSDGYQPGPFVPDWKTGNAESPPAAAPVLIAPKTTYDDGENVELRVRPGAPAAGDGKCPALFQTVRDSTGTVLWEITNPRLVNSANGCVAQSSWGGKWWGPKDEYPVELRLNGVLGQIALGKRIVTVSELAGTGPDGELRLVPSNPLTLTVVDPATIQRTWGENEEGVRADLTVDNLTYTVGEDIPLHLAIENASASRPLYSMPLDGGACPSDYTVHVEKEDGSPPEFFQLPFFPMSAAVCVAGYRRNPLVVGKIVPIEDTLSQLGSLPSRPGVYRITVSWRVYDTPSSGSDRANLNQQRPYVIVTSAASTLRIMQSEAPN